MGKKNKNRVGLHGCWCLKPLLSSKLTKASFQMSEAALSFLTCVPHTWLRVHVARGFLKMPLSWSHFIPVNQCLEEGGGEGTYLLKSYLVLQFQIHFLS